MKLLLLAAVVIGGLLVAAGLAMMVNTGLGIVALGLEIAAFGLFADDGQPA